MEHTSLVIGRLHDKEGQMSPLPEGRDIYTVDEVAAYLLLNRKTVLNLLTQNKLKGFRAGRSWRITKQAVDEFIEGKSPEKSTESS